MAPPKLFPFRYRDPRTGRWVHAGYRAEKHEIAARYSEWEIIGPPEIRDVDPDGRYFASRKMQRGRLPIPDPNDRRDAGRRRSP